MTLRPDSVVEMSTLASSESPSPTFAMGGLSEKKRTSDDLAVVSRAPPIESPPPPPMSPSLSTSTHQQQGQQGTPTAAPHGVTASAYPAVQFAPAHLLGLTAFGFMCTLGGFRNSGLLNPDSSLAMIYAMACWVGGFGLGSASLAAFLSNKPFPMIAFMSFAGFWMCNPFITIFSKLGYTIEVDHGSLAAWLFLYGLFCLAGFATVLHHRAHFVSVGIWTGLFIMFWARSLSELLLHTHHRTSGKVFGRIGGILGILIGLSALYSVFAELNDWPLFPRKKKQN